MEFNWSVIPFGLAFLAIAIIEGIALFNSKRGDTLSEHLWAWLGTRRSIIYSPGIINSKVVVTPKWTLRVARILFFGFLIWLAFHIATGGQV